MFSSSSLLSPSLSSPSLFLSPRRPASALLTRFSYLPSYDSPIFVACCLSLSPAPTSFHRSIDTRVRSTHPYQPCCPLPVPATDDNLLFRLPIQLCLPTTITEWFECVQLNWRIPEPYAFQSRDAALALAPIAVRYPVAVRVSARRTCPQGYGMAYRMHMLLFRVGCLVCM